MKICMIGAGYVGFVSAACFSEFGWDVVCVDNDPERVASLNRGEVPIYEPGLDDLLARNIHGGRLTFTGDLAPAVQDAEVIFLAVGTPMRRGDGHADLSYVFAAVEDLAPHLDGFTVITTKSTVPVGTSRDIEERLKEVRPDADVAVCSNPEFLARRLGHPGFHASRPRARRHRRPACARGDGASLQAVGPAQCADHLRQPGIGGARQVRGQRLPRAEDQLHQRDRRSVRGGRRRRPGGRRRDRRAIAASATSSCIRDRATAARASPRTSPL